MRGGISLVEIACSTSTSAPSTPMAMKQNSLAAMPAWISEDNAIRLTR